MPGRYWVDLKNSLLYHREVAYVKLNVSLDEEVASLLKSRAAEAGKPVSQYLGQLIREAEKRRLEALAEEGYRELGASSLEFARSAQPLADEVWSDW